MSNPSDDPLFGRLEAIDEFKRLTPLQKQILIEHQKNPSAPKAELARIVGCTPNTISALFYSEKFEKVNNELAMQAVRELVQKAIRTIDECLNSTNDSVRYAAAAKILADAGILRAEPKSIKQDNKILVMWGDAKTAPPIKQIIDAGS